MTNKTSQDISISSTKSSTMGDQDRRYLLYLRSMYGSNSVPLFGTLMCGMLIVLLSIMIAFTSNTTLSTQDLVSASSLTKSSDGAMYDVPIIQ